MLGPAIWAQQEGEEEEEELGKNQNSDPTHETFLYSKGARRGGDGRGGEQNEACAP